MSRVSHGVSRSVAMLVLLVFGAAERASAGALDPLDFTSLGDFPSAPGTYTYSFNGTTPTLTEPNGTALTGIVSNGVSVFDFSSINLSSNQSLAFVPIIPPPPSPPPLSLAPPLALLSRGDAAINGTIDVSVPLIFVPGPAPGFTPGGPGGFGSGGGPGAGGTGGQAGFGFPPGGSPTLLFGGGGGGGFGGRGGAGGGPSFNFPPLPPASANGGPGGGTYGNLLSQLQGGSGGAGGFGNPTLISGALGGGGGGAIELGAIGKVSINGSIRADGSGSFASPDAGLGGGSGGGIFLHGDSVTLTGLLSARGGDGSPAGFFTPGKVELVVGGGGGGGGGQVTILYGPGGFSESGATIDAGGGAGGNGQGFFGGSAGSPGAAGVVTIAAVPEPASLALLGLGLIGVLVYARYARTLKAV